MAAWRGSYHLISVSLSVSVIIFKHAMSPLPSSALLNGSQIHLISPLLLFFSSSYWQWQLAALYIWEIPLFYYLNQKPVSTFMHFSLGLSPFLFTCGDPSINMVLPKLIVHLLYIYTYTLYMDSGLHSLLFVPYFFIFPVLQCLISF